MDIGERGAEFESFQVPGVSQQRSHMGVGVQGNGTKGRGGVDCGGGGGVNLAEAGVGKREQEGVLRRKNGNDVREDLVRERQERDGATGKPA